MGIKSNRPKSGQYVSENWICVSSQHWEQARREATNFKGSGVNGQDQGDCMFEDRSGNGCRYEGGM